MVVKVSSEIQGDPGGFRVGENDVETGAPSREGMVTRYPEPVSRSEYSSVRMPVMLGQHSREQING